MSELYSGYSEICQNSTYFLEYNIVNNLTRKTAVNTGPLEW